MIVSQWTPMWERYPNSSWGWRGIINPELFGAVTAWLALNGEMATAIDGTRSLTNSRGTDVVSTTGQMLDFNGTSEQLTVTRDISTAKTILFNFSDFNGVSSAIFDTNESFGSSFTIRAEANSLRFYYKDVDSGTSAVWHDIIEVGMDYSATTRYAFVSEPNAVKIYFDGVLKESFKAMAGDIISSTSTNFFMSEKGFGTYAHGGLGNIQIWDKVFSEADMAYDFAEPEKAYQLAFAQQTNSYIEDVTIPTYDSGDATHLLITTVNGAWTQANFDVGTTYRHFYIEAGNYGSTRINLEAIGTTAGEYTLSLHNGNDTHPAALSDALQANCYFEIRGKYWTVDRVSFLGSALGLTASTTPACRLINEASNNILSRWHCRDFKAGYQVYNRVGSWGMCNYNTIQNSYIHDQVDVVAGTVYDGIAMSLFAYGADVIDTIGNKFISNDISNCGDSFQSTRTTGNGDTTKNGEGTIVYDNVSWLTSDVYRDATGTLDPLGEYAQAEECIDLKFGSENPLNPMIIEKNIAFDYMPSLKDGVLAKQPKAFFSHFGVRNLHINYNLSVNNGGLISLNSAENYQCIGNICVDSNLVNPNDIGFIDALSLSDANDGVVTDNVIIRHSSNTAGSGDAISTVSSSLGVIDGTVIVSSKDLAIGATDTITNTWLYNHTGTDAGETTNVYTTEAEAVLADYSFMYERYTATPKVKTIESAISTALSPHFGVAGTLPDRHNGLGANLMLPLTEGTGSPVETLTGATVDSSSFLAIATSWASQSGLSTGLQRIAMTDDIMSFDATQATQVVTAVPATPYSVKEIADGVTYIYTDDGVKQYLYTDGVQSASTPIVGNLEMSTTSQISGLTITERTVFEIYTRIIEG